MNADARHINTRSIDYQNIELLAYHLYLGEGSLEGRALDHWIEAKKQLRENLFSDQENEIQSLTLRLRNAEFLYKNELKKAAAKDAIIK